MPSTVISSINYDENACRLTITFVSGKIYEYKDVPEEIYNGLKTSRSKGIYFNEYIKDKYEYEKVQ